MARRDSKHRILRVGESIRSDGRYQFKYIVNGKAKFVYSWRLEPTDKTPLGRRPGPCLRDLEKEIGKLEKRQAAIEKVLAAPGPKDDVMELTREYLENKRSLDAFTEEWSEQMEKLDN